MANVGSLVVDLRLRAAQYSAGLQSAIAQTSRFSSAVVNRFSRAARVVSKFGGVLAGLSGAAGGAGLSIFIGRQMAAVDAASKLSRQLGVSTEFLSGLQHAANLSGTSVDQLAQSVRRFQLVVASAASGGAGADVLARIGLDAESLSGISTEEGFLRVLDAIGKIADQSDRMRALYTIFGRTGAQLSEFVILGRSGLRDLVIEADRLGLAFSRSVGLSVEEANDAVTRALSAISGIVRTVAINVAPLIAGVANDVRAWLDGLDGVESALRRVADSVLRVVRAAEGARDTLRGTFVGLHLLIREQLLLPIVRLGEQVGEIFRFFSSGVAQASKKFSFWVPGRDFTEALAAIAGPVGNKLASVFSSLRADVEAVNDSLRDTAEHLIFGQRESFADRIAARIRDYYASARESAESAARALRDAAPLVSSVAESAGRAEESLDAAAVASPSSWRSLGRFDLVGPGRIVSSPQHSARRSALSASAPIGTRGEVRVRDDGIDTTNQLLKKILEQQRRGSVAVAG